MLPKFKVSFYLRSNYENKEGKSPVMLRIFLNKEMLNLGSTKVFVQKSKWSNSTCRMRGKTSEALFANTKLDSISNELYDIFQEHQKDANLTLDKIRSIFFGEDRKDNIGFLAVYEKFLNDIGLEVGKTRTLC